MAESFPTQKSPWQLHIMMMMFQVKNSVRQSSWITDLSEWKSTAEFHERQAIHALECRYLNLNGDSLFRQTYTVPNSVLKKQLNRSKFL